MTSIATEPLGSRLVRMRPSELIPSPENAIVYQAFNPEAEGDDRRLVESMRKGGFRDSEPILITGDGYILDGHRRREAAIHAALKGVPVVIMSDIRRDDMTEDDYTALLTTFNAGTREKTPAEAIAEAAMEIDPDETFIRLRRHKSNPMQNDLCEMKLPDAARRRAAIGKAKAPLLEAASAIV